MIEELISHAPESFAIHARNPNTAVVIGGNNIMYGTWARPPKRA